MFFNILNKFCDLEKKDSILLGILCYILLLKLYKRMTSILTLVILLDFIILFAQKTKNSKSDDNFDLSNSLEFLRNI